MFGITISHIVMAVLFLVIGYWLAGKYPGLLTKATGGAVSG